MNVAQLRYLLDDVNDNAYLFVNQDGNLRIVFQDEYVGYIDFGSSTIEWLDY